MDNYSLSDLAAVSKDNDGWGGSGGAWWIIILFLFVFMGGGWGGFNRQGEFGQYATAASQQEILFGQHFGQLNDRITNVGNGLCTLGYEMQGNIGQLGREVALAQAGTNTTIMQTGNSIQGQIAQCCCDNRLATANLSAQMDRQTCDITTAIHAEGEATRALMQANELQALRDKVASLEMDNRMCGVVRYPNGLTYSAGSSPFCGCNSGCGNI
ncbi:MAG TPA: hypothetical protein DIT79_01025 [Ruminococcaceae bacterium]|nr:hypothetical protein [Oscillospiraceae bacterium]